MPRSGQNKDPDAALSQQTALARFGEQALREDDLQTILDTACRLVGEALGTHLAKLMELQPGGETLLVRAGFGWRPGVVGHVQVPGGERSAEGQAIRTGRAVISTDIATETRFDYPEFVREHGVQALVTVVIVGAEGRPPYGVLQVDSRTPRSFAPTDVQFIRGYANLVAAAVERLRILTELRQRADEKERLLQELQHRIKNNLMTVSSLVHRRVRRSRDQKVVEELRAVGDGIEALRLVHEKIYNSEGDGERTCLGTYMGELAASLLRFHGKDVMARVRLVTDVERMDVTPDVAIPMGLIASEFITNSLKYAFGDGAGVIGLQVRHRDAGQAVVVLWDDGSGTLPAGSGGTGLQIMEGLAQQVGGTAHWDRSAGTRLEIRLAVPLP